MSSSDDDDQEGRAPSPSPAKKKRKRKPLAKEPARRGARDDVDGEEPDRAAPDPAELARGARAERGIRLQLMLAAAAAIVGIALVGTGPSLPGMALVIAGVLGLVVGIHRFGRLGPEG